ncbi:MAG: potassium-transporting ATPase subunit KdpA [Pigmentiphaga sp.]|uniref:potassium-transporting ATPase subunit KdpA n=1 Tax=Pigmentiphaga sp. TaxID=1977564 RepID=UPI0029BC458E|nr:potassium-transporting ATPase subunit KdpA [Pigmentiphaga sp.]MDX3908074.1 potassium-transporting ATPase subunit KdpA [Pigmentiphaga sp.]
MDTKPLLLLALYLAVLLATAPFLGRYIRIVMDDAPSRWTAWGRPLERIIYRLAGIDARAETDWKAYALAVAAFNLLGVVAVYALQRVQPWLPFNPAGLAAVAPDSAINTAVSFVTNTNWQGYAGETTMSYLTQMLGLGVQNFVSAATGIAVLFALMRALARHGGSSVGNFWADLVRSTLYVLLPLSLLLAVVLVSQGVIQNLDPYLTVHTLEGQAQTLPMGPVASQEAIKLLGTNGGGFFNANSAHPFENPTALSNFLEMLAILLIPAALCMTFGELVGNRGQGVAILAAMAVLFVIFAVATGYFESQPNPMLAQAAGDASPLVAGNMEGKETRFGIAASVLFAVVTTAASCGAVNAMHDSLTAMGGFSPLLLMQLGEVVFGGVGSGLYGMLVFAITGVFIAGLMIGRTPEFLGKKIESREMKMVAIVLLATPLLVLLGTAIAVSVAPGRAGIFNPGMHGFSEVLYALSSAANNNGSAFAGLAANTPFYNLLLALAMWCGRFAVIVPVLALAGSLVTKRRIPPGPGTLPTAGPLFVVLLVGTVLALGALTYIPALALGPVAEHLQP